MHLGAFLFNLGNHVAAWRHPETAPAGLMDLRFYAHLAQVAERGCFDFVFHSDGVGINDTYPEIVGHTVTIRPEPTTLLSALAALTSRIGRPPPSPPPTTSRMPSPARSPPWTISAADGRR